LKLNTDTDKEFELCNAMGTKCFNMYSTDDSLSIYKPTTQGGSKNIYIGGNNENAPLKIVGNDVFINGVKFVPPAAPAAPAAAVIPKVHATAKIAFIISPTITITNGGSGYTSLLTVSIAEPPVGGTRATATPTLGTDANAGKIASIRLDNPGAGYISVPTITLNRNGGTGVDATATTSLTISPTITITNGGSGYTSAPIATIDPPPTGGTQATATATLGTAVGTTDKVVSITLTAAGSGYTSVPNITLTGGGIV